MQPVEWAEAAKDDLRAIWSYIAEGSVDAANRQVRRINDLCAKLAGSPRMGRQRPELGATVRSFPARRYVVFYTITSAGIRVLRVLQGNRNVEDLRLE